MQVLDKEENDSTGIPPKYYDCAAGFCGDHQKRLPEPCRQCPVEASRLEFEKETVRELDKRVGDGWKEFGLEDLVRTVYQVSGLEIDDRTTYQAARLIRIFKNEESRRQRADGYNRWRKSKDNG
jgi:hypothetical protein